jgi:thiamine pyrophosphokinase
MDLASSPRGPLPSSADASEAHPPDPRSDVRATWDAIVLAAGAPLPARLLPQLTAVLDATPLVIAADGGLAHAHRVDREADVLVGDLDSVGEAALVRAEAHGTTVLRHPVDKDATDLALALDQALTMLGTRTSPHVLVVGGHGGRSDHLLGNALLLAADRYAPLRLTAWWGEDVLDVVRDEVLLEGHPGSTVSLLAVHGRATGVTTTGLRFPLLDATLEPGSPLGISNVMSGRSATVHLATGVLLAVRVDHHVLSDPATPPLTEEHLA